MIRSPSMLTVMASSAVTIVSVLYSAVNACKLMATPTLQPYAPLQHVLQRKMFLVSKMVFYLFCFQLLSLFLFVYTADNICTSLSGAMCAVGSLAANRYGFPVLFLKLIDFFLAGLWLVLNYADDKAVGHPLLREKYLGVLLLTPLLVLENVLQFLYFLQLHPDMTTSCCGILFDLSSSKEFLAAFPPVRLMIVLFYLCTVATIISGLLVIESDKGKYAFGILNASTLVISLVSIVSFISLYFYQTPTLHCPFCMLQKQYWFVGYILYGLLFLGCLSGLGVGLLQPFHKRRNLEEALPPIQRMLAAAAVMLLSIFILFTTLQLAFSTFRMQM